MEVILAVYSQPYCFYFHFSPFAHTHEPRNILIIIGVVGVLCWVFLYSILKSAELRSHFGQFAACIESGFQPSKVVVENIHELQTDQSKKLFGQGAVEPF